MDKLLQLRQAIGAILLLAGALALVGWWTRTEALVQLIPGVVAMVANTALCFMLAGAALLMQRLQGPAAPMGQQVAGAAILAIATVAGAQNVVGADFGIDQLIVKTWLADTNPHPGRMAPMTSIAFALTGTFFLARERLQKTAHTMLPLQVIALAVMMLGIVGVTGYTLKLDLLYSWYRFVRMAPNTAACFILLGVALWLTWYRGLRRDGRYGQGDAGRITAIATFILLVMALTAGLVGFVLSAQRAEAALNHNLAAAHANRVQLLKVVIDHTLGQVGALASAAPLLQEYARAAQPAGARADGALARHLLSDGYLAVVAFDAAGTPVLTAGDPLPAGTTVLAMRHGARLLWQSNPVLEVRVPVRAGERQLGAIVAQRRLPVLATLLKDAELLGISGEIAVCAPLPERALSCLPTRLHPKEFGPVPRVRDGKLLPMSLGVDGKKGLTISRDYRGNLVMAAYGPVGTTGLGLVVKVDAVDLYEPIRTQLETLIALLVLLVGSGILLLRWQLTPLIAALLLAQRQARAGEEKIQAVVDTMADGLISIDEAGAITSINPAAAVMFGHAPEEAIGAGVELFMPERLRHLHAGGLARYVAGGPAHIVGRAAVRVTGQRKDGSEFPMQIAVREAHVEGGRIFVGILRDITAQKNALETSSRFNAFLEATPNLVAFVGEQRELLYINGAGRAMLGLAPGEDCSALAMDQFGCGDAQAPSMREIFPSDESNAWRGEYALCGRDGVKVPLMFTVVRILGQDGEANSYAMVGVDVSERKRAEDALRKTLERFSLLSRATNDTVWDWDFGTNEIVWNAGIEVTYGHAPDDVAPAADWWVAHIHPEDAQSVVESVEAEIGGGGQYWTGEYRFQRADGSYAHVHDRGYIIRDQAGKAVRMIGAIMDISARKQVEERLRQLEQRFSTIFSMSPVAISVSRMADGAVLEVNDAFVRMFGYRRDQLDQHSALLRHAVDSPGDHRLVSELIADGGTIGDVETQLHTSAGAVITVLFSAEMVELDGEPHLLCLYNDITERKRTEHALRVSEEKFRSIVETTKDWVWTTDADDRLVYSNPAVAGMLGYAPDELLGTVMLEHLHPDEDETVRTELRRLRARGEGWTDWHLRWRHKDGSERYLKSSAVPVLGAEGEVVGYRGTDHDLTAIKKFEIALRESKLRAESANQAKSEFLANMSHEIRTPLNGVIGLTKLVLRTGLSAQQQEYMELIEASADSLLRLLNDILDFSKMEAKKLELEMVEFDLREEVGNVLRSFAASALDKDLELAFDIGPEVPPLVVGDNGRLAQVLINLTSNAIKFTKHGEVVLRVAQESLAGDQALLHFSVSDTGIGISPQQQSRIFAPFVQADASTTRQYGGSGLGLAIVSQIIGLMDGRLWVESEAGLGTTFHFTVRLRVPERRADGARPARSAELKERRILVADANPTTGAIVGAILRSWGMEPVLVDSGACALSELRRAAAAGEPHAVALYDSRQQVGAGLDLVRAMQACGQAASTLIVMSSGREAHADVDAYRAAGVTEFVRKPVKHSELFVALMKVLRLDLQGRVDSGAAPFALRGLRQARPPRVLRVLVAEDHPINQMLVTELLRARGHFYDVAHNGLEALRMLELGEFDAILMDGQMPEMDGYQATAEIRRREQATGRHIHIVAVTAHAMKEDREACLAAGMDGYIAKPIEPDELIASLERPWTTQPVADGPRTFDLEAALARTRGKKALLLQMAEVFLSDAPEVIVELRDAAASADTARIERSAHRMKGAAANLSGGPLVEAAVRVERLAREQPPAGHERMQAAIAELESCMESLAAALTNYLEQDQ